jgi:hypothetical protein
LLGTKRTELILLINSIQAQSAHLSNWEKIRYSAVFTISYYNLFFSLCWHSSLLHGRVHPNLHQADCCVCQTGPIIISPCGRLGLTSRGPPRPPTPPPCRPRSESEVMAPPANNRRRSRLLSWPVLFVAILAVHSLAIYLFTRGFLLTRTELDLHSSRDDLPRDVSPGCGSWPPPAVDRLVIVVLDALRCSSPRLIPY